MRGYRAPSFSITKESWWALDVLGELGFTYDSSIFPVKHPNYGLPQGSRVPFSVQTPSGVLVEFPLPTLELGGMRAPFGGGAYLQILPYRYTKWAINYLNQNESAPVCVYLHPWEIDVDQPRLKARLTSRLRHYAGLRRTESKLRKLLSDFEFVPLGALVEEWQSESIRQKALPSWRKLDQPSERASKSFQMTSSRLHEVGQGLAEFT